MNKKSSYETYGHFSQDNLEFMITRPDTPAPWVNYISNGCYHGLVSHVAGGYSFFVSPRDSRISRWRYNSLPADRPGRYILIRNRDTETYWSPTWQPTRTPLEFYRCRHGLYYTIIESVFQGIQAQILYFVPDDDLEIWRLLLKNDGGETQRLDLFAFTELCLGHALVDLINQPNDQHFNEAFFEETSQILYASKRYWVTYSGPTVKQANQAWDKFVFFASDSPVASWDTSRDLFIGRWRSEADPVAVERGVCSNSNITSGDTVGALHAPVELKPGEECYVSFFLGVVPKEDFRTHAEKVIHKYRKPGMVESSFEQLKKFWRQYIHGVQIQTPDESMNRMINVWNQYQTSVTFRFSRDASYYHGGLLFGRGYRDSCQDLMGPLIPHAEWAAQRIREMSTFQMKDGSTFHLYYPLSGGGERTGHTDTPLWFPLSVMMYLKETADYAFLEEQTSFYDSGKATILDHLFAAIDFTLANLTDRKLAKFGPGDWNDTLDYLGREGRGESVWVTMFLCFILKETAALCAVLGRDDKHRNYLDAYRTLAAAINKHCWDGEWYIRGTDDRGNQIGSHKNSEGKIFLNTQTWAVISEIAPPDRVRSCLNSVKKHLDTPKGPKILHPAYTKIDPHIGLATRCVPGKKENGAVFNHTVSWAILAECIHGDGERAYEIYRKSLPMNPVIDIDRYQIEPYVYPEYVTSPDHPTFGQASHSWLTGSAVWMLRDAIDYILGIRPDYFGLRIDPCIPSSWKQYTVHRRFRGTEFQIKIENPRGKQRGIDKLTIENQSIRGNLIDMTSDDVKKIIGDRKLIHVVAELS